MNNTNTANGLPKPKKWFNFSNVLTVAMLALVLAMLVSPNVKAYLIQGLMQIGLFAPNVPQDKNGLALNSKAVNFNAAEVKFINANQQAITLAQLSGKVVFINFWATWCPPCIAEMPSINRLYQRYKTNANVVFLIVDADGDLKKSGSFLKRKNYDLPLYIPASNIPTALFAGSLPTTLVLNKQGKVVFNHEGSANYDDKAFVKFLESLL